MRFKLLVNGEEIEFDLGEREYSIHNVAPTQRPGLSDIMEGETAQKDAHGTEEARHITLLRAAHTLLKKQYDAKIVLNILAETVFYDDAECDGNCLLNDIEYYFDEIGVNIPEEERVNP